MHRLMIVESAELAPPAIPTRLGTSAALMIVRRFAMIGLLAVSTAVLAHLLGVARFGAYSAALATTQLAAAASDLGFSSVLAREMAVRPAERGAILAAALREWSLWTLTLAAGLVALGVISGTGTDRGIALIALAPSLLVDCLSGFRQLFYVLYRTGTMVKLDLLSTVVQAALITSVVAAGGGVLGAAAAMTAAIIFNALVRAAAPLGIASLLSSVYFTIDLVIVGWIVAPVEVGHYAAAVKFLNIIVAIPSVLLTAALPALSAACREREQLTELAARVWHWILAIALPLCVGAAVFAPTLIHIAFGRGYVAAVPLLRILALAGIGSMVSSVLNAILIGQYRARAQLAINSLALAVNVGLNVALVPRYGVVAAAWTTVGTEVLVFTTIVTLLRGTLRWRPSMGVTWRPAAAAALAAILGLALRRTPGLAIPASVLLYIAATYLLGAWPREWSPRALLRAQ